MIRVWQKPVSGKLAVLISTFFAVDLLISALVFWVHLYRKAQRTQRFQGFLGVPCVSAVRLILIRGAPSHIKF